MFLSVVIVVSVFGRRAYLNHKKKNQPILEEVPVEEEVEIKKAKPRDRQESASLCARGDELLKKGKEDEAIKCFISALDIDPQNIEALDRLGMLYMQKQMYNAAGALFEQLVEITKEALHYSHLGFALYQQNELEGAKSAYQKSVSIDANRPQRFISLAQVYRQLKFPHHALMAVNKAVELDPENRDYVYLISDIKTDMGLHEEAVELIDQLLVENPEDQDLMEIKNQIMNKISSTESPSGL